MNEGQGIPHEHSCNLHTDAYMLCVFFGLHNNVLIVFLIYIYILMQRVMVCFILSNVPNSDSEMLTGSIK